MTLSCESEPTEMIDTPAAAPAALQLPQPYLLFLGDTTEPGFAKTAFGLRDWASDLCVGEFAIANATVTTGLPRMTPVEAVRQGARSLVIGVANGGGVIPPAWRPALLEALAAGLDLVSGMHVRLGNLPGLSQAAATLGRRLIDVRVPPTDIPIANGRKRSGRRLLTVGTDCAIGKKYAALALHRAMRARGWNADFRATGQTGILIAGGGIPIDSVVADFLAGAAEALSPAGPPGHWDVIEGQGSLFHPSYAGVSLGLLHGSQPDALVLCVDPERLEIDGCPGFLLPSAAEAIARNLEAARLTNPACVCVGVAFNGSRQTAAEKAPTVARLERETGLPVLDPLADDLGPILDRLAG